MNRMDIDAFATNANEIIGGLPSHRTRGPVCVTRAGVPEAVVIRAEAYAPRLHDFEPYGGGVICHRCDPPALIPADATSLDVIVRAANKHWHETHRKDDRP